MTNTSNRSHLHHDDFGGLHRDLRATGAVMDRRDLFRIAARLGVGVSALSILGCSGDTQTAPSSSSSTGGGTGSTCSWPHIHFEVYPSLASSTSVANKSATSQIALTRDASALVYAQSGYSGSTANLAQVSLASDMVFSDGSALELATITGSVTEGYTATLTVAV